METENNFGTRYRMEFNTWIDMYLTFKYISKIDIYLYNEISSVVRFSKMNNFIGVITDLLKAIRRKL